MTYYERINGLLRNEVAKPERIVLFGQNIAAGSCLSGLTRGLSVKPGGRVINTTNSENSLVGFGFGLLLGGVSGVFFMKQMDFLLLGIDQLVNTYNVIRSAKGGNIGSFTIVAVVVDSGYEGPQSSLNNFADFCSIARVPGYAVTNETDAEYLISKHLTRPGFRIIGVSQRLKGREIIQSAKPLAIVGDGAIFQYSDGNDVTLVSFNFSFPQANALRETLEREGIRTAHFNVNAELAGNWELIRKSVTKTKKLVVVDDSKSAHIPADALLAELCTEVEVRKKIVLKRDMNGDVFKPVSDVFELDEEKIIHELKT